VRWQRKSDSSNLPFENHKKLANNGKNNNRDPQNPAKESPTCLANKPSHNNYQIAYKLLDL
jgi:hypothetical protein